MRKILLLSLIIASPMALAGPQCTTAERSQWQDEKAFQDKLKAEGYTISKFSFDAATGAGNFTTTPVPEPGTSALLLAGIATLGWLARRRRA